MTKHSRKSTKLKNVNPVRGRTENVTVQEIESLPYQNQNIRAYLGKINPFEIDKYKSSTESFGIRHIIIFI